MTMMMTVIIIIMNEPTDLCQGQVSNLPLTSWGGLAERFYLVVHCGIGAKPSAARSRVNYLKSICHGANLEFTPKVAESDCGVGPEPDFDFLAWD